MLKGKSRRLAIVHAALCLILFFPLSSFASPPERILGFQSHITVRKDSSLLVKETIRVKSESDKIRHGIYRDFPVTYRDRFGNSSVVGFEVKEVRKDSSPESFHIENRSNGKRVYIGRKETLIPPGEYTYTLIYTTDHQLGFFKDFDELYWNVTGNDWEFPIDDVLALIELPEGASQHIISVAAYTGPQGSKGQDFTESVDTSGVIRFSVTRPLAATEGLTIAVSWPKGYVVAPSKEERIRYFLSGNPGIIVGPSGLILLLFYYLVIWTRVGRDPDQGIIVTRYAPPDGMSPAVMRFISRMGYDQKAFASALIHMAVKGQLMIRQEHDAFTLSKKDGGTLPLSAEEAKIRQKLFASNTELILEQSNHKKIRGAEDDLKNYLKITYEKIHFVTNKGYFVSGLCLSALILFLAGFGDARAKGQLPVFLFISLWLTIWSVGVTGLLMQVISRWKSALRRNGNSFLSGGGALFLTLFSLPFIAGEIGGIYMLGYATSALMVFFLLGAVFINYLFYHLLKAPTRAGRNILDAIEGFRNFLTATEKDRMNLMNPPTKTPELFEKYLPYALALDVEQQWAEQFSHMLSRVTAEGEPRGYIPAWYSTTVLDSVSQGDFASSFGDSLAGAIASSSAAPGSSSGSGGGGSSGGGGGGGGGGGW